MKRTSWRWLALLVTAAVLLPTPGTTALAQEATPEQRAEVRKLVRERDRLHQELENLDRRAAEAIKQGEEPVDLHAQQVNVQDELDLVTLRLELLATRYDLPVPALPGEQDVRHEPQETENVAEAVERSLGRARTRAMQRVHADYERFLASLDFREFLDLDQ